MDNLFKTREYLLKEVKLEVTYNCPLACIHCSSNSSPTEKTEMEIGIARRLVNEIIDLQIDTLTFSGGEPLVWDGLIDLASICKTNQLGFRIYTSGNVNNFTDKIKEFKKLGLEKVVFSIFGGDQIAHEQITRVRGSFDKTLNSVNEATNMGIESEFHFVPLQLNYTELENIIDLATRNGVPRISVLRFVPQGRGAVDTNLILTKNEDIELKKVIIDSKKKIDIRTGSPYNYLLINDNPTCEAGIDRLIIAPDYRIYPCDAFKQVKAEDIVGSLDYSILDTFSLNDCWQKSGYLLAVRELLDKPFAEVCSTCSLINNCVSGCIAQKTIKRGYLNNEPDPSCLKGYG